MTKQFSIDQKLIQVFNKKPTVPKQTIKKVYARIPDDKHIPIQFMSKKQYLKRYIKNQESKHNIDFPKKQENTYIQKESIGMNNIVSRYTTKHNPYYPPAVVFFNDKKISKKQFTINAAHEFGHELWEKNKKIRHNWNFPKATSPTLYGTTNRQEDFADSFAIFKNKSLPLVSNPACKPKDLKNRFDMITRLPTKDITSQNMAWKKRNINDYYPFGTIHQAPDTELVTPVTYTFPQHNTIIAKEKHLKPLGQFSQLFRDSNKIRILNPRTQETVRQAELKGDTVEIGAGPGTDVLKIPKNQPLYYEPWNMDRGSVLFNLGEKAPPGLKHQNLKLATEGDTVEYHVPDEDIKSKNYSLITGLSKISVYAKMPKI